MTLSHPHNKRFLTNSLVVVALFHVLRFVLCFYVLQRSHFSAPFVTLLSDPTTAPNALCSTRTAHPHQLESRVEGCYSIYGAGFLFSGCPAFPVGFSIFPSSMIDERAFLGQRRQLLIELYVYNRIGWNRKNHKRRFWLESKKWMSLSRKVTKSNDYFNVNIRVKDPVRFEPGNHIESEYWLL